jgi:hypothetical protein
MFTRLTTRSSVVTLLGVIALAAPAAASAAPHPHHNHGLTIATTTNPLVAGEGVLIYGRLQGADSAGQRILLFHRINPAAQFSLIGTTRTNSAGYYEFVRADGIVKSNRNWYVVGPGGTHSRTIHELVSSIVTLSTASPTSLSGQSVDFTGTVFPAHPDQRVLIQEQESNSGTGWHTVASGLTDSSSAFNIEHRFALAGSYTLRAYFPSDVRNIAGQSDAVTLTVGQTQNPSFTINGSSPVVSAAQPETISGTLYAAGSTTTPQTNTMVTLYGRQYNGNWAPLSTTTTNSTTGDYSFSTTPIHNMAFVVKTTDPPIVATANLYVGVQDAVTVNASASSVNVGDPVTVSGTVTPDHAGHAVNLQRLTPSGSWVDVATGSLNPSSGYSFNYAFGQLGSFQLRVQIPGGPLNVAVASTPVSVTVSAVAPASSLPAAP